MITEATLDFVGKVEPEKLHRFTCPVFNYLTCYIKIGFYLCIFPFKAVVDGGGKLHIQHYKLQQLACLILQVSSLQFGMTSLWKILKATTFTSFGHPPSLYEKVVYTLFIVGIVIFVFDSWCRKSNPYKNLLKCAFEYGETNPESFYSKHAGLTVYSLAILQIAATSYPEVMGYWQLIHLKFTFSDTLNLLTVIQSVYYHIMFHIAVIMPFLLSPFCMFLIGQRFKTLKEASSVMSQSTTKMDGLLQLMEYYLDVKSLVNGLNETFGKTTTVIFLSMIPTLGFGLSRLLSSSSTSSIPTSESLRTVYILVTTYICVLLAANGSSHVQDFTKTAFEQMWRNGSLKQPNNDNHVRLFAIMKYVDSSNAAVGCTPFFVFTYSFIGSMTSALITYTIIMVQFREGK